MKCSDVMRTASMPSPSCYSASGWLYPHLLYPHLQLWQWQGQFLSLIDSQDGVGGSLACQLHCLSVDNRDVFSTS